MAMASQEAVPSAVHPTVGAMVMTPALMKAKAGTSTTLLFVTSCEDRVAVIGRKRASSVTENVATVVDVAAADTPGIYRDSIFPILLICSVALWGAAHGPEKVPALVNSS